MCWFQGVDPQASTKPLTKGESSAADPGVKEEGPATASGGEGTPPSAEEEDPAWGDLFPHNQLEEANPQTFPLAGRFGTAQLEDENLAHALRQVSVLDGKD